MPNAVWYDVATEVRTKVLTLSLPLPAGGNLPSAQVYLRKVLTDRSATLPFVMIAPAGVETVEPYSNERELYGYPVAVAVAAASNQDHELDTDDEEYLRWRELILLKFVGKRLGVTDVVEARPCRVEPGPVLDPALWQSANLWVQFFTLRFFAVLTRSS